MEVCRAGLQSTLLVRHPECDELFVNLDTQILTMIREADCMTRMGLDVPLLARTLQSRQGEYKVICSKLQVRHAYIARERVQRE